MLIVCAVCDSLLEQASPAFVLTAFRYKMCYIIFKKEDAVTGQTFFNLPEENRRIPITC